MTRFALSLLLCATMAYTPAMAEQAPTQSSSQPAMTQSFERQHQAKIRGSALDYKTVVGPTAVDTRHGAASIVSFAYLRNDKGAASSTNDERPVVFLFNGGPIAASLWIHLGPFAPYRVDIPADLSASQAQYRLVANPDSVLDVADLVFVDPADTGFSRRQPGTDEDAFASVESDAEQFAAFIRNWLEANDRANAPVYLVGESYGTIRAPAIIAALARDDTSPKVDVEGAMLLGQAVNIVEYSQRADNIISFVASLPTIAATAWYHEAVDRNGRALGQFIDEATRFAKGPYLNALFQGSDLSATERESVAQGLEEFSGIPSEYYLAHELRLTKEEYRLALFADEGLLIGRMDSRYVAPVTDQGARPDPSGVIGDGYEALWADYVTDVLGVTTQSPYVPLHSVQSLEEWDWGGTSPFSDWPYGQAINTEMQRNPGFRIVIGNGIFDTQTTIGAADYLRTQSAWDPQRTALRYYFGGHMGYSDARASRAMADDLHDLVTGAPMLSLPTISERD